MKSSSKEDSLDSLRNFLNFDELLSLTTLTTYNNSDLALTPLDVQIFLRQKHLGSPIELSGSMPIGVDLNVCHRPWHASPFQLKRSFTYGRCERATRLSRVGRNVQLGGPCQSYLGSANFSLNSSLGENSICSIGNPTYWGGG